MDNESETRVLLREDCCFLSRSSQKEVNRSQQSLTHDAMFCSHSSDGYEPSRFLLQGVNELEVSLQHLMERERPSD